jgi:hypothetical protein
LLLGAQNGDAEFLGGDLAEVIVYGGILSAANRGHVEDYLQSKWGISY